MPSKRFPQESLFRETGHSVHSSVYLNKYDCSLHNIKHLGTLDNDISNESRHEHCVETVHLFICEKKGPVSVATLQSYPEKNCNLQLEKKHMPASWWPMQYSLLTIYFLYVAVEMERRFSESFLGKLGITCNITAAVWLLNCFLNKWTKKHVTTFCKNLPEKKGGSIYGSVAWKWRKEERNCLYANVNDNNQKRRNLLLWQCQVAMTEKKRKKQQFLGPKSFFIFRSHQLFTSFSYQRALSFIHGLQHNYFLEQGNLYWLCRFWKISRQIWSILMVQKWLELFECEIQSF